MPIRRQYFDWQRPALATAVGWLWERYERGGVWDLDRVIVALPGGRAGRRLLELLVERAEERRAVLVPPRIVTVGQLPELLYEVKKPLADDLAQQFGLGAGDRRSRRTEVARLVKRLPAADDLAGWLALAEHAGPRASRAGGRYGSIFRTSSRQGGHLADFREAERWQALAGSASSAICEILDAL